MIRFEILPASVSLETLRPDWDALYARGGREPSVSYEWSSAILRNHLAGRGDSFTVVLRRDGAVVGIVPMMTTRERLLGQSIVTLQPVQEKNNTHSDLLLAENSAELVGAWLDAIRSRKGDWDLLRMSRLLEHGAFTETLSRELVRRQLAHRWRLEKPSFFLPLPASFEAYLPAVGQAPELSQASGEEACFRRAGGLSPCEGEGRVRRTL
jgi:CelD/BcsL family acetyltransferase involved in cellulose biosynthesis